MNCEEEYRVIVDSRLTDGGKVVLPASLYPQEGS
jgi:hypothetical protein